MDATNSSRTTLDPTISNSLYNDHLEDGVPSSEKKVEDATTKAKADYAGAVSQHRILDNKFLKIRSLNPDHQKVYAFGVSWFGLNKDQEIVVGQHIKFKSTMLKSLLMLESYSDLKDHFDEEYEILEVTPIYTNGAEAKEAECKAEAEKAECKAEAKEAECKAEAEKAECKAEAEKAECKAEAKEAEEAFDDKELAPKLAAECKEVECEEVKHESNNKVLTIKSLNPNNQETYNLGAGWFGTNEEKFVVGQHIKFDQVHGNYLQLILLNKPELQTDEEFEVLQVD